MPNRTEIQIRAFDGCRVTALAGVKKGWVGIAYPSDDDDMPLSVAFADGMRMRYTPGQVRVVPLDRTRFLAAGGLEGDCEPDPTDGEED